MKVLACASLLLVAVLAPAGPDTAGTPETRAFDDPAGDVAAPPGRGDGPVLDLHRLTVSRGGPGKMEISVETYAAIPKTPKTECCFAIYFDLDDNQATGRRYGDIGVDLVVAMARKPQEMQWTCTVDRLSPLTTNGNFKVSNFNVRGSSVSAVVSSDVFRKAASSFPFYAESLAGGAVLDRAPDEGFLRW